MSETSPPSPPLPALHVLLVEDDLVTRQLLRLAIEGLGHQVTDEAGGHEGWHRFRQHDFDLVVSDWDMPELDGLELCRRIRRFPRERYAYFILVTAKSSLAEYQEAMEAGADDFLAKPVDQRELAIRMRVASRILSFRAELNRLTAILPICSYCKKVRDDKEYWQKVETYLESHLELGVSHSICPDCYRTHMGADKG